MPAIVEIPRIITDALPYFADLFANEPQREHLAEYLTGLIVARRKSVNGMHDEFAVTTDQSCWNRFLTAVAWDVQALNERRLAWLQEDPTTRYEDHGVIALDDVLIDHDGKLIDDVGWYWDHAEERYKVAHDLLFANYVCPNGKHYPLEFRVFKKRESCEVAGEKFHDHGVLFRELIAWVVAHDIPGDFTFDSYFSSAENLNYIHSQMDHRGQPRGYVGDLKINRKITYRNREIRADELAAYRHPNVASEPSFPSASVRATAEKSFVRVDRSSLGPCQLVTSRVGLLDPRTARTLACHNDSIPCAFLVAARSFCLRIPKADCISSIAYGSSFAPLATCRRQMRQVREPVAAIRSPWGEMASALNPVFKSPCGPNRCKMSPPLLLRNVTSPRILSPVTNHSACDAKAAVAWVASTTNRSAKDRVCKSQTRTELSRPSAWQVTAKRPSCETANAKHSLIDRSAGAISPTISPVVRSTMAKRA